MGMRFRALPEPLVCFAIEKRPSPPPSPCCERWCWTRLRRLILSATTGKPSTICSNSVPAGLSPGPYINGVAGGLGVALPLDHQRPALGRPQVGRRGQTKQHDRIGGGGQPDRHPQHPAEGNPAGELADPRAGQRVAGRPRPRNPEGKARLCHPGVAGRCALRRNELAELDVATIQQREGRWVLADLEGKGRRIRTVAIPIWVKQGIDVWTTVAGSTKAGCCARSRRAGRSIATP
jgi:hypothetical protein